VVTGSSTSWRVYERNRGKEISRIARQGTKPACGGMAGLHPVLVREIPRFYCSGLDRSGIVRLGVTPRPVFERLGSCGVAAS